MKDNILLPRVLITNDDGIHATGIATLADVLEPLTKELWIVAPEKDQSGASQKLSINQPLHVQKLGPRRFCVDGTPSDCVAMAVHHLMGRKKPTLVISGVNAMSNVGDEVPLSGTIGAALTALMQDIPAIAVSQEAACHDTVPWETTRTILPLVLTRLLREGWKKGTCPSINIPNLPPEKILGYSWARQGRKNISVIDINKRINPRGQEYYWLEVKSPRTCEPQSNNEETVLKRGEVSIVAISLDHSIEINEPSVSFKDPPTEEELLTFDEKIDV